MGKSMAGDIPAGRLPGTHEGDDMRTQPVLIPDKQGRLIDIDERRGGWKITSAPGE